MVARKKKGGGGSGICISLEISKSGSRKSRKTFFSDVVANFNLSIYNIFMDHYLRASCTIGLLSRKKS